jgi:hypothetical protein
MDACKTTNSTPVAIPDGAFTPVPLDTTLYETSGMHSTSVDNDRIKVLSDGRYDVQGAATFEPGGGAIRELIVQKNGTNLGGTPVCAKSDVPVGDGNYHSIETQARGIDMVTGDWFNMIAYQDSGAPLNIIAGEDFTPALYVIKVG